MKRQNGMTLIELVIVIIVLGIIATVAAPRMLDISGSAVDASVDGAKGAFKTAVSMAQAADRSANPSWTTLTSGLDEQFVIGAGSITVDVDGGGADLTINGYTGATVADCTGGSAHDGTGATVVTAYSLDGGTTCTVL